MSDIVERLKLQLPVCPYDRRSPHYYEDHAVCPVCRGTESGPDLCKSADTRIMDEAAELITTIRASLAKAEAQREMLRKSRDALHIEASCLIADCELLAVALERIVREAKLDGLESRAGWDCWINLADTTLASYRKESGQ